MIAWYGIVTIVFGLLAAVTALIVFATKRQPNDFTILPAVISAILLAVQIVIMIVAPFVGNPAKGDPLEIWLYMITAFALPIGAGIWALVDRTKWANLVLAVVQVSIAVMVWRMMVLWF